VTSADHRLGMIGSVYVSARQLADLVLDPGTWASWDERPVEPPDADERYQAQLAAARERTGVDESVVTGEGTVRGRRVAVLLCEFGFLAGSIGVAAAERLVRAVERATRERLPIVASPTSGGTRMQEGTVAFLQMIKISAAVARHKAAGLPYLVYLRHPTTGGVLASWGSLGQVTAAERGALIGFLGPRVYEALYGTGFPAGVQVAENLVDRGVIDAAVPPEQLRDITANVLDVVRGTADVVRSRVAPVPADALVDVPAWESITRSRRPDRPGVRALVRVAASHVTPLSGTAAGERDPGLYLALAKFGSAPCVVLGQDHRAQQAPHAFGPAGLREARRGMRLAEELRLPLVTVIDTAGAALSREAEEGGLAAEIARCLAELVVLEAPTVCLLLGQGAGGGALALLPADRLIAAQHAWLSPLPPEGASELLHRTTSHAPQVAADMGVRSLDLLRRGVVDRVVGERPDAADEPEPLLRRLGSVLEEELLTLLCGDPVVRVEQRVQRHRRIGLARGGGEPRKSG
jgi:acetyl-CoA carboxylase carboxyl transferase beta subunit